MLSPSPAAIPDRRHRQHAGRARPPAWPLRTMQRTGPTPCSTQARR